MRPSDALRYTEAVAQGRDVPDGDERGTASHRLADYSGYHPAFGLCV
jgi:hypothetical protein